MFEFLGIIKTALGITESGIAIFDRFKKGSSPQPNVASRFIQLFEAHAVHPNQIPEFFGHDLSLADINNSERLLEKLSDDVLTDAANLFKVRREWLYCADDQVYETHCFYKQPKEYGKFITELTATDNVRFMAHLYLSTDSKWQEDAALLISEEIGHIGDKTICRYYICSGWVHKYWKARADIAACIALSLKNGVYMHGHWVKNSIVDFCNGYALPSATSQFSLDRKEHKKHSRNSWHPDSWVFDPHDFIDGVDAGNFGKANALACWLEYDEKGLMETNYHREPETKAFRALLEQI